MKRIFFFIVGCIAFVLGTIGILIPLLPTVPFYLLTTFCWLRSSKNFHDKFVSSSWYHKYVKQMVLEKQMTFKQRRKALTVIFIIMAVPFVLVPNTLMRACLVIIFTAHCFFFYFYFKKKEVKLVKQKSEVEKVKS